MRCHIEENNDQHIFYNDPCSFSFMIGCMKDMLFFLFIKMISDNGGFHSNQDGIAIGYMVSQACSPSTKRGLRQG